MLVFLSILLLCSVLGLFGLFAGFIYYDIQSQKIGLEKSIHKNIRTEEELMNIVFSVLERKWAYRVEFHFKFKEITVPKFEFEWNYLMEETIRSISPDVFKELEYYYKSDEVVMKAVSELIQIYLHNYMERNQIRITEE